MSPSREVAEALSRRYLEAFPREAAEELERLPPEEAVRVLEQVPLETAAEVWAGLTPQGRRG